MSAGSAPRSTRVASSSKVRLDTLLVDRGLAVSRERARALVLAGHVLVNGVPAPKAGTLVAADANLRLLERDHPYVGRGGVKLAHALDAFGIDVAGRLALDVGASTGGFTDVLLRRGASLVVAVDVGRGQLDWKLRTDARVVVVEGVNARALSAAMLPERARRFGIITIDVAFISLTKVLPPIVPLADDHGSIVALVKPQFEAGRAEVGKGGVVRDPLVHEQVIARVTADAARIGLKRIGMTPSPIEGAEGNREFFLHLQRNDGA
jgi:23S rRNA (cytidine1920-2'-O)/16S rRNA (cytidine1409-2'-O)-methyltransferase